MAEKSSVMLIVVIEALGLRWFVAALSDAGTFLPLLRSDDGDLDRIEGQAFDDQVDFLRHRLCGVVQRGCDRLWARDLRAEQFVFIFDGDLGTQGGHLVEAIAEHFTIWMVNPPAVVFRLRHEAGGRTERLAGSLPPASQQALDVHLPGVLEARVNSGLWEQSRKKVPGAGA